GVPWSVVVNGTVYRSTTNTINLNAPNGTHSYAIGVVPGWTVSNFHGNFTVNAAAVAVVVNWTRVLYPLTFAESGLSNGTNWSVVANGTNLSSTGLTISFSEPNGTFQYSVGSVAGLTPVTYSGAVTVEGAAVVVPISWNATPSALWFNETGLPIGKPWSVTLNGTPQAAATASFTFYEPSGMYSYLIGTIPGWSTPSYHGVVTPSGASLTTNVVWTQANYTVTFNETNLPLATSWTVSLNGTNQSSPTKSIVFSELNGTYPYVIHGVTGYHPQFGSTGSVVVNGSSLVVSVPWKRNVFTVNFNETGLPVNGFPWYVNVTGTSFSPHAKSFGSTSPVFVSNGSYTYSVSPSVATFGATVPYGNFTVNGTFVDVNVTFAAVYTLTFTETGLPSGTNWSVTIQNQVSESSTTTTIAFKETNGLYNFSFRPIPGWSPSTTGRSVTVFGANVGVSVSWSVAMYSVTFNETGLPSGTPWSVTLNGILQSGPGGNLTFSEPNGTFGWSLGVVPGWTTSSFSGSVTVQGNSVVVLVTWTQVTYTVTFTESGLTAGTSWSVNLSGTVSSSISTTIRFNEPNGTYAYAVGPLAGRTAHPASGNVPVSGGSASVAILWTLKTYGVTFMESNLTAGTTWSVTFNGTTNSSSTSSIGFYAPNGTYGYTIGALGGWTTPSYTGTVTINGNGATVTLVWTGVKSTVTFKERGLPSGSLWNVTIGGITITNTTSGTSGWITFSLYDGSYNFLVGTLPNRSASPSHGTVVVSGVDQSIAIVWSHLKAYFVTFTESGLPSGTRWSLSLGNSTLSSTTPTIVFSEFNGTYNYSVPAASGYTATPARGTLQVTGADLAETLSFSLSTAPTYPVTFLESGLSGGTRWFVTIGGTTENSTTDQIVFQLPNGTSSWQVPLVAGYQAGTSSGTVNVVGAGQTVDVVFVATPILYTLTFSESGLPSGTSWSVTIGGVTHESNGSGSVTFQEHNGTYTYQVGSVSGYSVSSSTGSTTLSGAAKAVRLTFTANPGTPRAFGGLSTLDWGIIGGGIAIILIALLVTLGLRGKGKEPATSLGTPPPSGASGPPSPP
ncbi:MAG: hypothetical protein L3K10_05150, partial [Thermoplasmata archaeon]|nr:hypothetical protein [Thermoplasmata archaeon]